jgi:hypothetical protein
MAPSLPTAFRAPPPVPVEDLPEREPPRVTDELAAHLSRKKAEARKRRH